MQNRLQMFEKSKYEQQTIKEIINKIENIKSKILKQKNPNV